MCFTASFIIWCICLIDVEMFLLDDPSPSNDEPFYSSEEEEDDEEEEEGMILSSSLLWTNMQSLLPQYCSNYSAPSI